MSIDVGAPEIVGFEQTATENFGGMASSDALAIIEKMNGAQIRGIVEEYILGISPIALARRHNIHASDIEEIIILTENDVRTENNTADSVALPPSHITNEQVTEAVSVIIVPEKETPEDPQAQLAETEDSLVAETGYIDLGQWSTRAACRNADPRQFDSRTKSEESDQITYAERRRQREIVAKYCLGCSVVNDCRSLAKTLPVNPGMVMGGMTSVELKKYRKTF